MRAGAPIFCTASLPRPNKSEAQAGADSGITGWQTEGDAASPPKAKGRGTKHRSKSRMDGGESEQNWAAAEVVAAEVLVAAT